MRMIFKRFLFGEFDIRNIFLFLRFFNIGYSGMISILYVNSIKDVFEVIFMNMVISRNEVNLIVFLNYFCVGIDYLIYLKFNYKIYEREIIDFLDVKIDLK